MFLIILRLLDDPIQDKLKIETYLSFGIWILHDNFDVLVWLKYEYFELNYVYVLDRQVLDRGGGL